MKLFLKQRLFGSLLCFAFFVSAIPFALRAQSDVAKEITVTLEGTFDGQDNFVFMGNTIRFRHISYQKPTGVTVDGKPWENLDEPFRLDFTPDFAKAAIVEKQGRGPVDLTVKQDSFTLEIDDKEASSAPYKVTIAVKNQGNREPAPSLATTQRAPESQPVQVVDPRRRGGIKKIPGRIYPKEFDERMRELEKNMSEKGRRTGLMMRSHSNPGSLSDEQKKEVRQWEDEENPLMMMREKTTDGKEIPAKSMGGLGPGDLLNRSLTHRTIEIEAVIDFAADFDIHENRITYNFSDGAVEGKFPREVKINGQPWPNLFVPFDLGMMVDPQSASDTWIETEFYQYVITPRKAKVSVSIKNRGFREEYVKIKMLLRRN